MSEKKFAVLSLNPCIDKTVELYSPLVAGGLNRTLSVRVDVGSKGANVATVLARLQSNKQAGGVEYFSFSGKSEHKTAGDISLNGIPENSLDSFYVSTEAGLRENIKIIDGDGVLTELNAKGGPFSTAEKDELLNKFLSCESSVACMCGSIPQGVEKGVYNFLVTELNKKGKFTVLDCDGEALIKGISAFPSLIKPNFSEALGLFNGSGLKISKKRELITLSVPWEQNGTKQSEAENCCVKDGGKQWETPEEVIRAANICGEISDFYGTQVLCTLGKSGALGVFPQQPHTVFYTSAPNVCSRGLSGAGDSFLAAYLHALFTMSYKPEDALVYAVAAGSAKVTLEGSRLPEVEMIEKILKYKK